MAIDNGRDINLCWDCRNQEQQSTARHSVLPAYLATKSWRLKKFFLQNITRIGPLSESTCEFCVHFLKYILLECEGLELLWQRVFVNIVIPEISSKSCPPLTMFSKFSKSCQCSPLTILLEPALVCPHCLGSSTSSRVGHSPAKASRMKSV